MKIVKTVSFQYCDVIVMLCQLENLLRWCSQSFQEIFLIIISLSFFRFSFNIFLLLRKIWNSIIKRKWKDEKNLKKTMNFLSFSWNSLFFNENIRIFFCFPLLSSSRQYNFCYNFNSAVIHFSYYFIFLFSAIICLQATQQSRGKEPLVKSGIYFSSSPNVLYNKTWNFFN